MTITTEDRASALRSSLDDAAKLIGSQRQTIRELREALEPFAAWLDVRETQRGLTGNPHHSDDTPVFMAASIAGEARITIGDLRKARAALSRTEERQ